FTVRARRTGSRRHGVNQEVPSAVTNEHGEYRLAELRGGSYILSASPEPQISPISLLAERGKKTQGYPTYFYPRVPHARVATAVRMMPGTRFQADMRLAQRPFYRIKGNISGGSPGTPAMVFAINEHGESLAAASSVLPGLTGFALEGMPPGSYLVIAAGVE